MEITQHSKYTCTFCGKVRTPVSWFWREQGHRVFKQGYQSKERFLRYQDQLWILQDDFETSMSHTCGSAVNCLKNLQPRPSLENSTEQQTIRQLPDTRGLFLCNVKQFYGISLTLQYALSTYRIPSSARPSVSGTAVDARRPWLVVPGPCPPPLPLPSAPPPAVFARSWRFKLFPNLFNLYASSCNKKHIKKKNVLEYTYGRARY